MDSITYKGNSVQHWYQKANAYGNIIMDIWKLPEIKKYMDGDTDVISAIEQALEENLKK